MTTRPANCSSCESDTCSARTRRPEESPEAFAERQALAENLCRIRHKVIVLSGKGGVGKSTVAANLAAVLAAEGRTVGLLDVDFHGPSIPRLLGVRGGRPRMSEHGKVAPLRAACGVQVMSIALLLNDAEGAVIWRGPLKMNLVKQLLRDVIWGEMDCLVIDSPPGTGDEPLSVAQLVPDVGGAVLVTTPQALSADDVRRSVAFCRQLNLPILGIIENMSGFVCPHCGGKSALFGSGGGERLAGEAGVPFLGRVPLAPEVVDSSDGGQSFVTAVPESPAARALRAAIEPVLRLVGPQSELKGA